ncbi:polyamine aminopropyltransferase [Streptomonospora wellingtoniae]|uniref:Spermidine synthase n=1 Tax=Streptomonospora wellingtoniae TaxID=3075544 RepID=A0ABU2KNQ2_9ACTN|nr:spermidine synthase [Streptomonospora sp. DSM 45055]MDT0300851.1 spermidine synthase [Streptomonospora sp. DSM 45055]
MGRRFEELDWRPTPMGDLVLRRRWDPVFRADVHEIKLGEDFLMSSLFTVAEEEMARLALGEPERGPMDVAVGGLGLGFTAEAVLDQPGVASLVVVEALGEVIEWHERGLIPAGARLTADPRCRFVHGDFFAMSGSEDGVDPQEPGRRFHAVLVDIDHSPRHLLDESHAGFYEAEGLRRLSRLLHPGGVFALWSNDPPEARFSAVLGEVFAEVRAEVVAFPNPLQERDAANTVYLATAHSA